MLALVDDHSDHPVDLARSIELAVPDAMTSREFEVTSADLSVLSFPNDGKFTLLIVPQVVASAG